MGSSAVTWWEDGAWIVQVGAERRTATTLRMAERAVARLDQDADELKVVQPQSFRSHRGVESDRREQAIALEGTGRTTEKRLLEAEADMARLRGVMALLDLRVQRADIVRLLGLSPPRGYKVIDEAIATFSGDADA